MNRQDRKAAIVAFKERKRAWGVYTVICDPHPTNMRFTFKVT